MGKDTVVKSIDIKRNAGSATVVSFGGGGGGSVDTSGFLLTDGSRPMAGILDMGTFAINNVGNVDGVDISAHAANANAHHNQVHVLANAGGLGGDHTITGGVAGYVLRVTGTTTAAIAQLQHSDLGGVTADQHHAQQHNILGSDHTITGTQVLDLVGIPSAINTLGIVRPSNNVITNVAAILATNSSGQVTVKGITGTTFVQSNAYVDAATYITAGTQVNTPKITNTTNLVVAAGTNVDLQPTGYVSLQDAKMFRSNSAASGWTGNGFMIGTLSGAGYAEVDNLTVRGTMKVYELVIQRIRATNGSIAVTSSGKVEGASFSTPNWTITTTEEHGFAAGDLIRAQRFTGNTIDRCDMTVVSVASKSFVATKRSGTDNPLVGMEFVRLGNTSDTARQGLVYITADEAMGPYLDVVNGVTTFAQWEGGSKVKLRLGNIQGVTGVSNDYGLVTWFGTYNGINTPTITASTNGFSIKNLDISVWTNNGTSDIQRVKIGQDATLVLKDANGVEKFNWNGTSLTVDGSGTFNGSITATSGLIGAWTITTAGIQSTSGLIRMQHGGTGVARVEVRNNTAADSTTRVAGLISRSTTNTPVFFAGAVTDYTDAANAPFQVYMNGNVIMKLATLTGATIVNSATPTMQLDSNGIRFVPDSNWGETKGYLFNSAIGGGVSTILGGYFGKFLAGSFFTTGIFANTDDDLNVKLTNINANINITAMTSGSGIAEVYLKATNASQTSYIQINNNLASGSVLISAGNGADKVVIRRSGVYYEVWDDSLATTRGAVLSSATNITLTGTGYLQTSQKLGAAWTAFTVSTQFNVIGGALYWKKFGDLVILRGFLDWDNSPAKTILISSADFPAAIRPTYEVNLWAHLSDSTMVKITIPTSGNVTCNIAVNKETQNLHIDNLCYTIS